MPHPYCVCFHLIFLWFLLDSLRDFTLFLPYVFCIMMFMIWLGCFLCILFVSEKLFEITISLELIWGLKMFFCLFVRKLQAEDLPFCLRFSRIFFITLCHINFLFFFNLGTKDKILKEFFFFLFWKLWIILNSDD